MNEETTNNSIVKFVQSNFENHISTNSFNLFPTDTFITKSETYTCKWKTKVGHFR